MDSLQFSYSSKCTRRANIMAILQENLLPLQCFGIWPSVNWQINTWKYLAYSIYTSYVIISIFWFALSGLIYLLVITDDIDDFSDTSFMLLSVLAICVKIIIAKFRRSEIIEVLSAFENHPLAAIDSKTKIIQDQSNERIRLFTLFYGIMTEVTVCYGTIAPFFQNLPFGALPYKAWVPYDYSVPIVYWLTYCQQLISVLMAANLNIGFDTIIVGFIMQVCTQFNMLKCRLHMIFDEFNAEEFSSTNESISKSQRNHEDCIIDCIKYHLAIYRITEKINSIFSHIIFVQYSASSIIICVSVLLMSQMSMSSPKFMTVSMYLSCMLLQIFMFCAAGDQATRECQTVMDDIYHTKWYTLSNRMRKYVFLMMMRSLRPVVFMSGHIVVLSLKSFCVLIKTSYSTYAMLQEYSN